MRPYTGTYTINGETYSYTIEAPNAAVFIHSKHVFCKIRILDSDSYPVVNRKIKLTLVTRSLEKYTNSNGSIVFDLARLLQISRGSYDDVKSELNLTYNDTNQLSKTELNTFTFRDGNLQFQAVQFDSLNGANDILDKFWYDANRRLRWFTNYPFTFDFPNINGNWKVSVNGDALASQAFPYVSTQRTYIMARINPKRFFISENRVISKAKFSGVGQLSIDALGNISPSSNTLEIIADNQILDFERKCYLRWIGKHGEVFYWLFKKHSIKDSVTRDSAKMAYVSEAFNSYGVLDNDTPCNYEKETTLTVYSCPVDDIDFETLKSIISSPLVDMLVSYSVSYTPRTQQTEQTEETENEGAEGRENSGGDDRANGNYIEETTSWRRVSVEKGAYTTIIDSDRRAVNKQLVLTLVLPTEGRISL